MTGSGWVPLHRSLHDRSDWLAPSRRDPANAGYAWTWIFSKAQHRPYSHGGEDLARGEVLISVSHLANAMGWKHRSRASRFLTRLCEEDMMRKIRETPHGTVYAVVNYDTYAVLRNSHGDSSAPREGQLGNHNKNKPPTTIDSSTTETVLRDPVEWPDAVLRSIAATYGIGREGTDEKLWRGEPNGVSLPDPSDQIERARLVRLAADRLQTEGRPYHGRQFRNTLVTVIRENHGTQRDAISASGRTGAVDSLFGGTDSDEARVGDG